MTGPLLSDVTPTADSGRTRLVMLAGTRVGQSSSLFDEMSHRASVGHDDLRWNTIGFQARAVVEWIGRLGGCAQSFDDVRAIFRGPLV